MIVRNISIMMMASMAMAVSMVIAVTGWTAYQNNLSAAADSAKMVKGGVEARIERLASLNLDYAAWNAAYENARDGNVEWLTENMGIAAAGGEFNVLEIVSPTDWSGLTWTADTIEEGTPPSGEPFVPIEMLRALHPTLQLFGRDTRDTQTTFAKIDGALYAIAVSRIQPWGRTAEIPASEFPLCVFALRLDRDFLSEVQDIYLIEDIALLDEHPEAGNFIPLESIDGSVVSYLSWSPPRPGDALIRTASLPVGLGLAVFLILTGRVTLQARRNAEKLVASEAEATRVARVDGMTGLPNRVALIEKFAELKETTGLLCTLILDLNCFKTVNDKYGHSVGDEYICRFSRLIGEAVREDGFAARLGGDEFAVLFHGSDAEECCRRFCAALSALSRSPLEIMQLSLQIEYAAGFSVGDLAQVRTGELLRQSDIAMYYAKNSRKFEPVKYDPSLEHDNIEEERVIEALRAALADCTEFDVVYQPIVETKTGRLSQAEALVRWTSPVLGSVSPSYFIPIAERTSLIIDLGRFVIDRVFSDLARLPGLDVSINLSPAQLKNPNIVREICDRARHHEVTPSRVTFEITETTFLENENVVSFLTDTLRERGFKIALDDFGTGYSSIGYLRRMKFDKLKVDKSFIDDIGVTDTGEHLLTSLCFLSRALGLQIVAEGVETERQFALLRRLSYDLVQGFYFSRPVPAAEMRDIVERKVGWSGIVGATGAA
jgi:diguanylate cyclase (GGDEF)-like protein